MHLFKSHQISMKCYPVVRFMSIMSGKFMKIRWIPFISHFEDIQEEPPNMCVWNASILVLIFHSICCNVFARTVANLPEKYVNITILPIFKSLVCLHHMHILSDLSHEENLTLFLCYLSPFCQLWSIEIHWYHVPKAYEE
jgi:hypothetical protein